MYHTADNHACSCTHMPEYTAKSTCMAVSDRHGWVKGVVKKCFGRAAKACVALEKWDAALVLCDRGLEMEVGFGDDTLRKVKEQAKRWSMCVCVCMYVCMYVYV